MNLPFALHLRPHLLVLCTLLFAIVAQSCNRCKPIGSVCESTDNSVITIDGGETYFFRQERIVNTEIIEKDSTLLLIYSISRNRNTSPSDVVVEFGLTVSLILNRLPDESLHFQSGSITFIKEDVREEPYYFQSPQLEINTYQCCACGSAKPGMLAAGGPDKLILTLKGPAVKDSTQQKQVEFRVYYITQKAPLEAC